MFKRNMSMNQKPNILLISADQLRQDALGIYENRVIKTPSIDALGAEGVVFDQHYCQNPYCMPSRWTVFTGRYPRAHGVRENGVVFKQEERTLAHILREKGYATGAFGKMHLTPQLYAVHEDDNWPEDDFGFQIKHLTNDSKRGEYLDDLKERDPETYKLVLKQGEEKIREDLASAADRTFDPAPQIWANPIPPELHQSSWIADKFIEFLDNREDEPFFSWVSFVDPHHPFDPPEPYASMYDPEKIPPPVKRENEFEDKPPHFDRMLRGYSPGNEKYDFRTVDQRGWQEVKAKYYGMVSLIDHNIGRIVESLKSKGLYENTIIIVTSDHGELLGDHGILFKGPFHYDSLIRVPFIIKWGNRICGGSRIPEITQHTDIVPTLLGLTNIPLPHGVQGRTLEPLMAGEQGFGYPFALIEHDNQAWGFNMKTLRSYEWRLTYYAGRNFGELYDLTKDPDELYNRWNDEEYRAVREELTATLLNRLIETEDRRPERIANY